MLRRATDKWHASKQGRQPWAGHSSPASSSNVASQTTALGGKRISAQASNQCVCSGLDATCEVIVTEPRQHRLVYDLLTHVMRQRSFQSIPNRYADLPLIGRDKKHNTIIITLAANAPLVGEVSCEVGHVPPAERGNRHDHHLMLR